ncbi:MAG: ATP-dependent DNA helicase RecG [Actinomycetes bacterium]
MTRVPTAVDEPLRALVGDRTAKVLADGLDLRTVGDLLRHYPRRYAERGELTDLSALRVDEHVTVMAEVERVREAPMRNRRGSRLEVVVTDGRGRLALTFFNRVGYHRQQLRVGRRGLFAGKVGEFRGTRQLAHPEYLLLADDAADDTLDSFVGALIPVYPATGAMPSWRLAKSVDVALARVDEVGDPLPPDVRERQRLVGLGEALRGVHRPESWEDVRAARRRLKWDEAFVLQVVLAQRRATAESVPATPRVAVDDGLLAAFDARLPFTLTAGQQSVSAAVAEDLSRSHPMHRLLQGEVGSGKTLVALRAMLAVVDSGGQAALLAPTEVLAQQHHRSITELLGPLAEGGMLGGDTRGTRVALLTGSLPTAARRTAMLDTASGDAGIVVGTHALLEEQVTFADLGLVVVDEQHRFGVEQRDTLRERATAGGRRPHVLVMTATPIPRTVAMTVFGDLDVSTLTELPAGRSPITTHVVPAAERPTYLERTWARLREEAGSGHQAYVVCPRIGEDGGDGDDAPDAGLAPDEAEEGARRPPLAVTDVAPMLAEGPLAGLRVDVLHGRLAPETKDQVMRRFAAGEVDVLVATTVVEVGVDVPNATAMVVMDADRFGVSQLHQLRGRVGRGAAPGLCLLVTDAPSDSPARERLDAVAATLDGFELSRIDLEQRREGDVLGARQSGRRSSLRMLAVIRDEELIAAAREEATVLVARDPHLDSSPVLADAVAEILDEERAGYLEKT